MPFNMAQADSDKFRNLAQYALIYWRSLAMLLDQPAVRQQIAVIINQKHEKLSYESLDS